MAATAMQLSLTMQVVSKVGEAPSGGKTCLTINAAPSDTVASLKQRVEAMEPLAGAYPGLGVFKCRGRVFADTEHLEDCGVKNGSKLAFVLQLSAEAFAQQLEELLQAARVDAVSLAELGLMFSYRYGVAAGSVLTAIGRHNETLGDFMQSCKQFAIENESACLLCRQPPLKVGATCKPLSPIPENAAHKDAIRAQVAVYAYPRGIAEVSTEAVAIIDDAQVLANDTGSAFKLRVAEMESVPFRDQELYYCGQVLGDDELIHDRISKATSAEMPRLDFVVRPSEDEFARQLVKILLARVRRASSPDELSLLYSCKHGVAVHRALQLLAFKGKFRNLLLARREFSLKNDCVVLAETSEVRLAEVWEIVVEVASSLNLQRIEKRSGHGNAGEAPIGATLVLKGGLPRTFDNGEGAWMCPLLQFLAAALRERFTRQDDESGGSLAKGCADVRVQRGAIHVCDVHGNVVVDLRLA